MRVTADSPSVMSAPSPNRTPAADKPTAMPRQKAPRGASLVEIFLIFDIKFLSDYSLLECLLDDVLWVAAIVTDDTVPHDVWENELHMVRQNVF